MTQFFTFFFEEINAFHRGFLTAILIVAVAYVVGKLIDHYVLGERKRAKGITTPGDRGSVFITSSAICDLAKRKSAEFSELRVARINLRKTRDFFTLDLDVGFDSDGEKHLPTVSEDLRSRIFNALRDVLGIERIKEININVVK